MEEALRALLLANAGVTALVGTRVTWSVRPQGSALPAIVLWLVSGVRDYTMSGREGLTPYTVQADIWANSAASAKAVSRAVLAALDGDVSPFQAVFIENERSGFDDEQPQPYHRITLDLRVWFHEA